MIRTLGILIGLLAIAGGAAAQTEVSNLAVLPFTVRSQQEPSKLRKVLQDLLVRQLRDEGVTVIDPEAVGSRGAETESAARASGQGLRADYVLYGSLNQFGQGISIDAELVDVSGRKKSEKLFAEEKGMENLALAANEISRQVAVRLLSKALIGDIRVVGNQRIEPAAVLSNIKTQKGELYRPEQLQEDIKNIYNMGYFEEVQADVSDSAAGKVLTFVVREKASIEEVRIKGNKEIKEKDILAAITTKPFTVLRKNVVNEDVQKILKLYHQDAYFNAEVSSDISFPQDPRKAVVTFNIKENNKVHLKKISFTGNEHFSDRKLRGVMQTKQKTFLLSLFTDRGVLQNDVLETDVDRLTAFYHDRGFMDAKVGTPEITREKDGFYIDIPIQEGERYKVKNVEIEDPEGVKEVSELKEKMELKPSDYFSREKLRDDMDKITKTYMDDGYAYTEVVPRVQQDRETHTTDVVLQVNAGQKVQIERIDISGNTKTRDHVIRRQIKLSEGELFSSSKLEMSNLNIRKLDYFEEAEIIPSEGSEPDQMNLHIKVKEKLTGSISVGGGFSSEDGLFTGGEIIQRNFLGKGQFLSLKAYFSGETQRYSFSYTDPWFLGSDWSAGFDIYDWYKEYNDFTKDAQGGKLRFGYPFGNWSRLYMAYTFENAKITDIDEDAPNTIKEQEGRQIKSSVSASLERDTTDHPFLPTRGSINSVSLEYATPYLGSDSHFMSYVVDSGWYVPLYWKFVGFFRGKFGWITEFDDDHPVPIYDRFFLGGINSLRAWDFGDVGPEEDGDIIGGLSFGLINMELLFPLVEKMGMRGVIFFDAGNAFDSEEAFALNKFRTDAGVGVRWASPLGPLRVEWGYNLDPEEDEDQSKWQFTVGAFF